MLPKRRKVIESSENESGSEQITGMGTKECQVADSPDSKPEKPPYLARIPPELFDEIFSHFKEPKPFSFSHVDTASSKPVYSERTNALRAVSQTCHALQAIARPMAWQHLNASIIPTHASGSYYKYVMRELRRKTTGVYNSKDIPPLIQAFTFMITKSGLEETLFSLTAFVKLPSLSHLRVIRVISCNVSGPLSKALSGVVLPTVRTVIVPTNAHSVLRMCPNATEVHCVSGSGKELIGALKFCHCEIFEGVVDWEQDGMMERLVKNAPSLCTLELCQGQYIRFRNAGRTRRWSSDILSLLKLKNLAEIKLTFFGQQIEKSNDAGIVATREILTKSPATKKKKLYVRRVNPNLRLDELDEPRYTCSVEEIV